MEEKINEHKTRNSRPLFCWLLHLLCFIKFDTFFLPKHLNLLSPLLSLPRSPVYFWNFHSNIFSLYPLILTPKYHNISHLYKSIIFSTTIMSYICDGVMKSHKVQNKYTSKYCIQHKYSNLKYIDPNKYIALLMIIS